LVFDETTRQLNYDDDLTPKDIEPYEKK